MAVSYERLLQELESKLLRDERVYRESEDTPAPGPSCSGWERDPQSFAKRTAEFYLRGAWRPAYRVASMYCYTPAPNWNCDVDVRDGSGGFVAVINVQLSPADKLVRVQRNSDPQGHMVCFYSYGCTANGQLVFKESSCPSL